MAILDVQKPAVDGSVVTFDAASNGGDSFPNTGSVRARVRNASAGPKDVVFEGFLSRVTADDIVGLGPIDLVPAQVRQGVADMIRGAQINMINRTDNLSYAAFGQVSYDVTDRLNVTAGLRFTQDRRRLFRRGGKAEEPVTAAFGSLISGAGVAAGASGFTMSSLVFSVTRRTPAP